MTQGSVQGGRSHQTLVSMNLHPISTFNTSLHLWHRAELKEVGHSRCQSLTKCLPLYYTQYMSVLVTQSVIKGGKSHQIPVTQHESPPLSTISHSAMNFLPLSTFSTCLFVSQNSIERGKSHQIPVTEHEPPPLSKISHSA